MNHLHLPLAAAAAPASDMRGAVSALVMAVMLTVVVVGAILVAISARRNAVGRDGPRGHDTTGARPVRGEHDAPRDAWAEAGRRMPVPPPDREQA